MENSLDTLEPQPLWRYFLTLSKIPRPSKHEAAAAQWCMEEAKALGCAVRQDVTGNVIITKAATPGKENRPGVCLQGHLDMVCEKNEGTVHDFMKDPIDVYRDGDWLKARGTTLGADNGIGVAMALAVLADKGIAHGPLEVLLTVNEEVGLTGAEELERGSLKAKYLINLDSEEEGEATIGCAGGIDTIAERKLTLSLAPAGKAYRIKVGGLLGGHSGQHIHVGRGNALRLLAQVIHTLGKTFTLPLASIQGGNMRNAIPREASAVVVLDPAQEGALREAIQRAEKTWQAAFGQFDPGVALTLEAAEATTVMSFADAKAVMGALLTLPHGMEAMSPTVSGVPQTSNNLGVLVTEGDIVRLRMLTRSALDASKAALVDRIHMALDLAGWTWRCTEGYPGWLPNPDSVLLTTTQETYQALFGKPINVTATHGGLECSLIGSKHPGMDMVSLGSGQHDIHTPNERLCITTTVKLWTLVKALLEKL